MNFYHFDIAVIGDLGVGKSTLIDTIETQEYVINKPGLPIPIVRIHDEEGDTFFIRLLDPYSPRKERDLPKWLRAVKAVFLCFDVTSQKSFSNLCYWVKLLEDVASSNPTVFLFQTNCDLPRTVSEQKAENYATEISAPLISVASNDTANT